MALEQHTILHRKDERGVIVETRIFGPDDEVPEGFGAVEYSKIHPVTAQRQPVAESRVRPVSTAAGRPTKQTESSDEVSEGTPLQAREQAGEDLTEVEQEALEQAVSDATDGLVEQVDESDEGTPRQAREQAEDGELTEAEKESDEGLTALDDSGDVQPPPQGGPGSGKEAWAQYAAARNVAVPEDATRDDIIGAVQKAGHPV